MKCGLVGGLGGRNLVIKHALLLLLFMSASRYASLSAFLARFARYFHAVSAAQETFPTAFVGM